MAQRDRVIALALAAWLFGTAIGPSLVVREP
jgi:hypothetical protein